MLLEYHYKTQVGNDAPNAALPPTFEANLIIKLTNIMQIKMYFVRNELGGSVTSHVIAGRVGGFRDLFGTSHFASHNHK